MAGMFDLRARKVLEPECLLNYLDGVWRMSFSNFIVGISVGIAFTMAGCSDSIEHQPISAESLPGGVTILTELNRHGLIPHEGRSYQYAINKSCMLNVSTRLSDSPYGRVSVDLTATQFERFDLAHGLGHAVRVANDVNHPNVFTSLSDEKADKVMGLLEQLSKICSGQK